MKKVVLGLALVAGLATSAMASTSSFNVVGSVSFTNKNSIDDVGDADNAVDTWISPSGGSVTAIRVVGSLTEINTSTFASEARVRITAGAGNSFTGFNLQHSTVNGFTGTLAVGPSTIGVTPFTLAPGGVNFQWFENGAGGQDGAANIAEARWDSISYEFGANIITNGNFAAGTLPSDGSALAFTGSNVAGGMDLYTFTVPAGVSATDYLNIVTGLGATDTELAIYDSLGNLVAEDDDGALTNFHSELSFGITDPNAQAGVTDNTNPGEDGLTLAGGTYTLVVAPYNTAWGATLGATVVGTDATGVGNYTLEFRYVPAPGALALLGLGGLVAGRRRR